MDVSDTKKRIFYAAAELFAQKTYGDVSMREIAKKAGIKASSIYTHYESKEKLLEEILRYYERRVKAFYEEWDERIRQDGYQPSLDDIAFHYDAKENQLMFWITRILYMEQFHSPLAAEMLLGGDSRRYAEGYRFYVNYLFESGFIRNSGNIDMYVELIMRLGYSFQLDFVHPEFTPNIKEFKVMLEFIIELIGKYEKNFGK